MPGELDLRGRAAARRRRRAAAPLGPPHRNGRDHRAPGPVDRTRRLERRTQDRQASCPTVPMEQLGRTLSAESLLVLGLVPRGGGQVGQLLAEGGGVAVAVAEGEALQAVAREAELGGELALVEQPDLLGRGTRDRRGRLDLEPAVAPQARGRRDQLADDDVLLQPEQAIRLALERRVREDLGGLLERRRREEGVRG